MKDEVQSEKEVTCRICLVNDPINPHDFVTPCKCSGSLQYVHTQCLLKWLNNIITKGNNRNQHEDLSCEICKQDYDIEMKTQLSCTSFQALKKKRKRELLVFVLSIIMIIGSLAVIGFFAYLAVSGKTRVDIPTPSTLSLVIAISILSFISVALVVMLLVKFLIKVRKEIVEIKNKERNTSTLFQISSSMFQAPLSQNKVAN